MNGTFTFCDAHFHRTRKEVSRETVTTYLYDANGSLTRKDDGTNTYDFRNLMSSYDGPGSSNDSE